VDTKRYRTSGSLLGVVQTYRTRNFPVSCANRTITPWSAYSSSAAQFGLQKSVFDVVTPDYHKKRKSGEWLPLNPYDVHERSVTSSGHTSLRDTTVTPGCTSPSIQWWSEFDGVLMPHHFSSFLGGYSPQTVLSDGRTSDLTTQVITQCMAGRRAGKANYVESIAELDKTYGMLVSPLENVRRYTETFRRTTSYRELQRLRKKYPSFRRFKAGMRLEKIARREINAMLVLASSEYLRFRYGISPLMADIRTAVDVLQKGWNRPPTWHASRSHGSVSAYVVKPVSLTEAYWTWNWVRVNTETVSIKASFWDSYRRNPFDEVGLTFHNVVAVPWELTKMSFVVDWFVNLGDLIYANVPRVNLVPLGGTYTVRDELWNSGYFTGYTGVNPSVVVRTGSYNDRVDMHDKRLSRAIITERMQRGGLVFKDDFRLTQYTRAADAVALVIQQLQALSF